MKTSEKVVAWIVVAAVIVLGVWFFLPKTAQQVAGDFPGGVVPTNLLTASVATQQVYPVGALAFAAPNGLYIDGQSASNEFTAFYTATTSYPATNITLAAITAATSTTSTVVGVPASGFSVGDACEVSYNGATTTGAFGADSFITAASAGSATATVTFWNGATSAILLTATSSATGVSSTLKVTCFHTGV